MNLAKKYLFAIDADGKPTVGTVLYYPEEYTHEVPEEVWDNRDRAQFVDGEWVIHDPLTVSGPSEVAMGEDFDVLVSVPQPSPDDAVFVTVIYDGEASEPQPVQLSGGSAVIPLRFDTAGVYTISVRSRYHGFASLGVAVNDAEQADPEE
ncbi:hypothetical protein IJ21_18050 [Paenibacillus sp. 32O-W]|uniref:hypothetical protein n=1 Tax=Paenibacillus sp. 32O-W TaxID=1695218 RepID=UPI000722CB21|nr:hypothetical protein [Paenibacillus sp. 32O-W]ALS27206.1 hypothetical protein IJ21_18050 [Paenibacillus sp. 32O-W]